MGFAPVEKAITFCRDNNMTNCLRFCFQTTASHMEGLPHGFLGYDVLLLVWRTGNMSTELHFPKNPLQNSWQKRSPKLCVRSLCQNNTQRASMRRTLTKKSSQWQHKCSRLWIYFSETNRICLIVFTFRDLYFLLLFLMFSKKLVSWG